MKGDATAHPPCSFNTELLSRSTPSVITGLSMDADLKACCRGDKRAWDSFVRSHAGIIYAAVQRALQYRGGNPSDLDDRVQDVFVRLVQNDFRLLKTYDSSRASLSTWLTLVSRSIVREHLQRRSLAATALSAEVPGSPPRFDDRELSISLNGLTER